VFANDYSLLAFLRQQQQQGLARREAVS